jgi:HEAT repeat protein
VLTQPGRTADPPPAKIDLDELAPHPDLEWLRRAKVPTDDAGLAKYLAGLRGPEADPAEVDRLVTQLRTGSKSEQDAAAAKLAEVGAIAVPVLRRHRLDADPAGAARVRACLAKIEEAADKPLARPAMRRLVRRQAPGAAEALLGYVPFAFDPEAELDAWYGLDELAAKDPKALAVLAGALADKQPARRAVAACILGRRGDGAQKKAVAGLLTDPDPVVRLRTAQGLLAGKDTVGVPTLIELLAHADADVEVRWQAEELLRWLAVDTAPDAVVGAGNPKAVEACRAAWRKWWTAQGQKADVAAAEREPRRPLLLLAYDRKGGRAWVVGCDGVTRHEWTGLDRLADAQYVPGGGVLTLHEQPVREKPLLAERDLSGKKLWQYDDMRDPTSIQRLPNGQVFVAERQLFEPRFWYQLVAAPGKKAASQADRIAGLGRAVALHRSEQGQVFAAWFFGERPDGIQTVSAMWAYDPSAEEARKLQFVGRHKSTLYSKGEFTVEATPHGYLLSNLPQGAVNEGSIIELDNDGYLIWNYNLAGARHAARLRGRSTIACVANRVVELSPDQRMTADIPTGSNPDEARPVLPLVRLGFDSFPTETDLAVSIAPWVAALQHESARDRLIALKRLAELGGEAAPAIPVIEKLKADPDPDVRAATEQALEAAGLKEVPALLAALKDTDPERREGAVNRLGNYPRFPGVIEALVAAVTDHDMAVRRQALAVLGGDEHDPQGKLADWQKRGRWRWAADKIIPALLKATDDEDHRVHFYAFHALGTMGREGKAAVPDLVKRVRDKRATDFDRWRLAAIALGKIGVPSRVVLDELNAALDAATDTNQRTAVVTALGFMGPAASSSVPNVINAIGKAESGQKGDGLRFAGVHTLEQIGADNKEVVRYLLRAIEDASLSNQVRGHAAGCLARLGIRAASALPTLARLAEDKRQTNWDSFDSSRKSLTRVIRQLAAGPNSAAHGEK